MSCRTHWVWWLLAAVAVVRFGLVAFGGLTNDRGDFYQTMPGAFAETLNPALWHSEDLAEATGYQRSGYLYGPTQYLTLAPAILTAPSYAVLARWLLVAYALVSRLRSHVNELSGSPS